MSTPDDLASLVESFIARGLRTLDQGAALARHLEENPPSAVRKERKRLQESITRALTIRGALEKVIELPELRGGPGDLSIKQIAEAAGVSVSTVTRYLETLKGKIGKEYAEARELGRPALFSPREAQWILRTCKRRKA